MAASRGFGRRFSHGRWLEAGATDPHGTMGVSARLTSRPSRGIRRRRRVRNRWTTLRSFPSWEVQPHLPFPDCPDCRCEFSLPPFFSQIRPSFASLSSLFSRVSPPNGEKTALKCSGGFSRRNRTSMWSNHTHLNGIRY